MRRIILFFLVFTSLIMEVDASTHPFPIQLDVSKTRLKLYQDFYLASIEYRFQEFDSLYFVISELPNSANLKEQVTRQYFAALYNTALELYEESTQAGVEVVKKSIKHEWKDLELSTRLILAANEYYLDHREICLKEMWKLFEETPDSLWSVKARLHNNIAAVSWEMGLSAKTQTAQDSIDQIVVYHYERAIELMARHGYHLTIPRVRALYAVFYSNKKQFDEAFKLLDTAQEEAEEAQLENLFHFLKIQRAKVLIETGKYKEAEQILREAESYYKQIQATSQTYHAVAILNQLYAKTGGVDKQNKILLELRELKKNQNLELLNRQTRLYRTHLEVFEEREKVAQKDQELKVEQLENLRIKTSRNQWVYGLSMVLLFVVFAALFVFQSQKRKAQAEKDRLVIEKSEETIHLVIGAQEQERKRIAQELHDGIGQQLSGLKMAIQHLADQFSKSNQSLKADFDKVVSIVSESSAEVRQLAHQMLPKSLKAKGLAVAVDDLFHEMNNVTNLKFSCDVSQIEAKRYDEVVELTFYRCIQEMLNNTLKHAEASQVDIQIYELKGQLMAVYSDNGKGFDALSGNNGFGLLSLQSRMERLGGSFNIESEPGQGFTGTLKITLQHES